ncbi:hypothetical protein BDV93DRAFT_153714 [Ceratobasidium sp. AG-I]|nr:hypothetical protein BDV93DRAFT_153714 [Ceratobasidium sp. AG-I]
MSQFKRPISALPISPAHRAKLMQGGYSTVADINAVSATELSRDLGLSIEDATMIIEASRPQTQLPTINAALTGVTSASQRAHIAIGGSQTAAALLGVPASATALSLGVTAIDDLLDGGALKGCVLEISGVPGSGRSAALTSVFTSALKAGHEVLVIDSRGDLTLSKLKDVASSLSSDSEQSTAKRLHHMSVTCLTELLSCVSTLAQYCADHPSIKLVIISHLSYHIQTSGASPQVRGKLLAQIKQHLIKTCGTGQVAVVATTSMAVKLVDEQGQPANFATGTKALLMPALGLYSP